MARLARCLKLEFFYGIPLPVEQGVSITTKNTVKVRLSLLPCFHFFKTLKRLKYTF